METLSVFKQMFSFIHPPLSLLFSNLDVWPECTEVCGAGHSASVSCLMKKTPSFYFLVSNITSHTGNKWEVRAGKLWWNLIYFSDHVALSAVTREMGLAQGHCSGADEGGAQIWSCQRLSCQKLCPANLSLTDTWPQLLVLRAAHQYLSFNSSEEKEKSGLHLILILASCVSFFLVPPVIDEMIPASEWVCSVPKITSFFCPFTLCTDEALFCSRLEQRGVSLVTKAHCLTRIEIDPLFATSVSFSERTIWAVTLVTLDSSAGQLLATAAD